MIKETLMYSDYNIVSSKPSVVDKDKMLRVVVGVTCPRCKVGSDGDIEHAQTRRCNSCGLEMTRYGNTLECAG